MKMRLAVIGAAITLAATPQSGQAQSSCANVNSIVGYLANLEENISLLERDMEVVPHNVALTQAERFEFWIQLDQQMRGFLESRHSLQVELGEAIACLIQYPIG